MKIAKVLGDLTLSRWHPLLAGGSYRLVAPLDLNELASLAPLGEGATIGAPSLIPRAEELVAYDNLGVGVGSLIALAEGGEAAQPFSPHDKPIDAYNAAILDSVRVAEAPED